MLESVNIDLKNTTAGGLVLNKYNEVLLIFRKNLWDLPKGKLDSFETLENAALREVSEETGVLKRYLELIKPLISTPYNSNKKGKKIKKKAKWFLMYYNNNNLDLFPELEESIEEALWVPISDLSNYLSQSRNYVPQVLQAYLRG